MGLLFPFLFRAELTQMVAWATMIHTYQQEGSLQRAVEDTFSGARPCPLCTSLTREQVDGNNGGRTQMTHRVQEPPMPYPPESLRAPGRHPPVVTAFFSPHCPGTGREVANRLFRPPRLFA